MGVTNLDALAVNSLTIGGSPSAASGKVGSGTTPATGWTVSASSHSYKDVTVSGAATGDIVLVSVDSAPVTGAAPPTRIYTWGRVTSANTVRLYVVVDDGATYSAGTTIVGAVSYAVFRP